MCLFCSSYQSSAALETPSKHADTMLELLDAGHLPCSVVRCSGKLAWAAWAGLGSKTGRWEAHDAIHVPGVICGALAIVSIYTMPQYQREVICGRLCCL